MGIIKNVIKISAVGAAALTLLIFAGCSGNTSSGATAPQAPSGRIKPVLLTASVVDGNSLSIPLATVQSNWNTRFAVATPGGKEMFMAYVYKGQTYVRASTCPPCGGESFSLVGDTLVCDLCGTVFSAQTGAWKVVPCKFPKQAAPTTVVDGNLVMKNADLVAAYNKTRNP